MTKITMAEKVKALRREEILEGALKAFDRNGFDRTTIAQICRESGIAKGTFYLYFSDKTQVLVALLAPFHQVLIEEMAIMNPDAITTEEELAQALHLFWQRLSEVLLSHKELTKIIIQESYRSAEVEQCRVTSFFQPMIELVTRLLDAGIEKGFVQPCDTAFTAQFVIGAVERGYYQWVLAEGAYPIKTMIDSSSVFLGRAVLKPDVAARLGSSETVQKREIGAAL